MTTTFHRGDRVRNVTTDERGTVIIGNLSYALVDVAWSDDGAQSVPASDLVLIPAAHELSAMMDWDSPVTVHADGTVTDSDEYAPSVLDDEIDSSEWAFFSTGYTGQYGYRGPIMHSSEQLDGRLAEDILDTPGTYVLVAAYYSAEGHEYDPTTLLDGGVVCHVCEGPEEDEAHDDTETTAEGWAVLRRIGD